MIRHFAAFVRCSASKPLLGMIGWLGFALATATLAGAVYLSWQVTRAHIVDSTEAGNVAITRIFLNEEWEQLAALLPPPELRDPGRLRARPENAAIERLVRRFSAGTDILRLKVYDLQGLTVYSSDPRQIGEDKSWNEGFIRARAGAPASELNYRGEFSAFDGELHDRNLVSSYLPAATKAGIQAVIEIYTDRTRSIAQANHAVTGLALALAPLVYGVFAVLLFVAWRADAARSRQQRALEKLLVENQEARAAAETANKVKSLFLANTSHEIRSPLTAIVGFAQATLAYDPQPEQRRSNLTTIVRNGEYLLNIINGILDLAKMEAGKLELDRCPVQLFSVLRDIESVCARHSAAKGIALDMHYEFPLPEQIMTDPTRLKQILLNITSNAIKFTQEGGVSVSVAYLVEDAAVRFVVTDTGIGMTPEQLAALFRPFAQADAATSRRFGGTGLGLHISKQLTEFLGGNISVSSTAGQGTRFEILIAAGMPRPQRFLHAVPQETAGAPGPAAPPVAPRLCGTVLLAEDIPDNQKLVGFYVEKTGAQMTVAANGAQAVELAMANDYDLILMDIYMPLMDGLEATALLRQAGFKGAIVAVSASSTTDELERFKKAGCDRILSKPIDWQLLYATMAAYLPARAQNEPDKDLSAPAAASGAAGAQLRELAASFLSGLPARMAAIRSAHAAQEWRRFTREVHDVKGMGSGFGYPRLTQAAAALESAIRAGTYDGIERLVLDLERQVLQATLASAEAA